MRAFSSEAGLTSLFEEFVAVLATGEGGSCA